MMPMKPYYERDGITIYHGAHGMVECAREKEAWSEEWVQAISGARSKASCGDHRRQAPRMERRECVCAGRSIACAARLPYDRPMRVLRLSEIGAASS